MIGRPGATRRVVAGAAAFAAGVVLLVGCSRGSGALTVSVTPHETLLDEPVHVQVSGAPAGATTTVTVDSRDRTGAAWRSSATFVADSRGAVDVDTDPSRGGTYTGVAGTGLVWSMRPESGVDAAYVWQTFGPSSFRVTVHAGRSTASTTFDRALTTTPARRPQPVAGL